LFWAPCSGLSKVFGFSLVLIIAINYSVFSAQSGGGAEYSEVSGFLFCTPIVSVAYVSGGFWFVSYYLLSHSRSLSRSACVPSVLAFR
jgi:hypothetical protein